MREKGRERKGNVVERRNRETARFDCCSLRKPVPLSSFIIFAATSPPPLRVRAETFSRRRNALSVMTMLLEVRRSAALNGTLRLLTVKIKKNI